MRCPVCRGWVGLQARTCGCGFDLTTNHVGGAIDSARRDAKKGVLLLIGGIAVSGLLVAFLAGPFATAGTRSLRGVVALVTAAVFCLGRGAWLVFDARRRIAIAERMRQPPVARVVVRDREPPAP
jgi:hypothetical protein